MISTIANISFKIFAAVFFAIVPSILSFIFDTILPTVSPVGPSSESVPAVSSTNIFSNKVINFLASASTTNSSVSIWRAPLVSQLSSIPQTFSF